MTKNRKLVLRDELPEWARFVDLDGIKAFAEAEMLEVPDTEWRWMADRSISVGDLFSWDATRQSDRFWAVIDALFTVEPLDLEAAKAQRRAEIDAEIERLKKEREGL